MKGTNVSVTGNCHCVLVEGPSWGDAEFYGRWLLAAAEAETFWQHAYRNSEFQKQVDRVCISYIPHFGISATLIIMELRDYRTSLMIDLNTEDGENFAMMVAMGFFTWSASRYEMTIPPNLTETQVKQAILKFAQTEDAEFVLHPEQLVTAISFAEARNWQDRTRAIERFHDNLWACPAALN